MYWQFTIQAQVLQRCEPDIKLQYLELLETDIGPRSGHELGRALTRGGNLTLLTLKLDFNTTLGTTGLEIILTHCPTLISLWQGVMNCVKAFEATQLWSSSILLTVASQLREERTSLTYSVFLGEQSFVLFYHLLTASMQLSGRMVDSFILLSFC